MHKSNGRAEMTRMKVAGLGALAALGLGVGTAPKADAAYVAYLYQDGTSVLVTGSGSIDTAGLVYDVTDTLGTRVQPDVGWIALNVSSVDLYESPSGPLSGPSSYGSGGAKFASTSTGSAVLFVAAGTIGVPAGYASGTPLGTSTDTFDATTLAGLGVTDGTYVWTWGSGLDADSFTLNIGPTGVPEPASLALLGFGVAAVASLRRRRESF
jgi:hypothetical protein